MKLATPDAGGAEATRPLHSYERPSLTETRVHVTGVDESTAGYAP